MIPNASRVVLNSFVCVGLTAAWLGCGRAPARDLAGPALAPADVAAGKDLYVANGCAVCHGPSGSGDGAVAATMPIKPRDFHDPKAYKNGSGIDTIAQSIATGVGDGPAGMPAYSHLSEQDRRRIATFLVSLQRTSP